MSKAKPYRLLLFPFLLALPLSAQTADPINVTIACSDNGRVFEGIGALSAGASSRLLIDYPEPQRTEILNFLFKPSYGASLHQLKVEIGGEVNSTCGTEPAHARTREEFVNPKPEHYQRGYEWWLMTEAKKRNPAIMLDVLQWGAPPWIGEKEIDFIDPARTSQGARDFTTTTDGSQSIRKNLGEREFRFFSQDNADFIADFILGAKKYHDLDINFCGIWNEITYEVSWIKQLRRTLDRKNLASVKIIAADLYTHNRWEIARDLADDPELARAVHAIGAHYPFFKSTPEAVASGKPLYASEDISAKNGDWNSAQSYARAFNRNYIQGKMTKTIFWSLIAAYYNYLDYSDCGPMQAINPWSGHYEVQPAIWAIAHTTQFIQPGWRYLDSACATTTGEFSYVTLINPAGTDFSFILESCKAMQPQRITINLDPSFDNKPISVWCSNIQNQFQRLPEVMAKNGRLTFDFERGSIYSLTTTTGQSKGMTTPPVLTNFPVPYADDFEAGTMGRLPRYFSDQEGAFEIARRPDNQGQCLFQTVTRKGIPWLRNFLQPYTVIGDREPTDYRISCSALIISQGSAAIGGRIPRSRADLAPGYWLEINTNGHWSLLAREIAKHTEPNGHKNEVPTARVLAEGQGSFAPDSWHSLALTFRQTTLIAELNGAVVASVTDSTFGQGASALMTGWNQGCFDNFALDDSDTKPLHSSHAQIPNVEWKEAPILSSNGSQSLGEKITPGPFAPTWESLETYEVPEWFRDAKFGIFMHWSVNSVAPGGNDGWYGRQMYMQKGAPWGKAYAHHVKTFGHPSKFGYKDLIPLWKAERFDPVELVNLYKKAGARYIVPVAVHHDNFDTYASTYQPWNSVNMGPKRDLIGEWEKAARAVGLRFGASSHSDRAQGWFDHARKSDTEGPLAGVPYDGLLTKADGKGLWWEGYDPVDLYGPALLSGEKSEQGKAEMDRYNTAWLNRTLELVNKYQLDLLYFDSNMPMGELGLKVTASLYNNRIKNGKTEGVLNIKWNPRRRAVVEDLEKGLSNFIRPYPWQLDASINNMWFADELPLELTASQIIHTLTDCTSKNGSLLLNVALRADGTADPEERRRLLQVGAWLDLNGEAIYTTRPTHLWGEGPTPVKNWLSVDKNLPAFTSSDIRYTTRDSSLYAIIMRLPNKVAHLLALRTEAGIFSGEISQVEILGCSEPVRWTRDALGLHITLPESVKTRPNGDSGIALKITGLKSLARDGIVRPLSDGTVQLNCWEAKIQGQRLAPMDYEPALSHWENPTEFPRWDFVCPSPGRYEIQASYTSDKGSSIAKIHTPWGVLDWNIAKTNDDKNFKLVSIGSVEVSKAGQYSLSVQPITGGWKPIKLSFVQLVRR